MKAFSQSTVFIFTMAVHTVLFVMIACFQDIQVQAAGVQPRPKLNVNPAWITDTDSATLSCEPPSHFSVSQCSFYTVRGGPQKASSCQQTLTAAQLLGMAQQTSPATVELRCFYSVNNGKVKSPNSSVSYITIGPKPQLSVQLFESEIIFTCSLPGSVKSGTRCNLYFGEGSHPVKTLNVSQSKGSKQNPWICQFYYPADKVMIHLLLAQRKVSSCDYTLGSDKKSLFPRSDPYSLSDRVKFVSNKAVTMETVSHSTQTTDRLTTLSARDTVKSVSESAVSTGTANPIVSKSSFPAATNIANLQPNTKMKESNNHIPIKTTEPSGQSVIDMTRWTLVAVGGVVITVVIILLVLACLKVKTKRDNETPNRQKSQLEDSDVYHVYCTVPEQPIPESQPDVVYSLLQKH